MVAGIIKLTALAALFCSNLVFTSAQNQQINRKESELDAIKKEISELETELKSQTKMEKESYALLENYNRQNYLLNKLINRLRTEEKSKAEEIQRGERRIEELRKAIETLQKNYAKYVVSTYKYGAANRWLHLLGSQSLSQILIRYKYLKSFSEKRKIDLEQLEKNKEEISLTITRLGIERREKLLLSEQKAGEERLLASKIKERKGIIAVIKKDKTSLRKELDAKKDAEIKIKNLIAKLIEEAEAARMRELEAAKAEKKLQPSKDIGSTRAKIATDDFASFSAQKGRLIWPIEEGKVIGNYGENRNLKLNTVTLNYGVDIKASKDLSVKAVAEGIVSLIDWLPGYGSVVIVTHKEEFRTVYSHLGEIYVNEGLKINSGSVIGKVGESLEGNILHFEIWNSRTNQNPEVWLAKR